ncbi:hypothetical protein EI555_020537, partial [Monodon monoceros]
LQSVYHEAFSSFEGVGVLLFRPDSAAVNASLVFGGLAPGPSAREVLWTLYRKVKAAGKMLGNLSLDESSLASDGSNLTDLALETTSIHLTAMRPFQPPLLLPGSAPFVLLEKTILRQVTPVLSGFYTARPQEEPLLLFSNAGQWVGVYIEYKFQTPIGTHLPGLANHLARNIMDPAVQKSSIMANAGKAELVQYEVWLQILDQPLTKGLRDKSSPKSQKLQGMLMRWVKWGRGERREEQEAGGFMCGDPTRLQYSCDPLPPLCSPADHRPQASAELRPSGGGEVPVRLWWLWVTWGPGLNSSGGASGSEKQPS